MLNRQWWQKMPKRGQGDHCGIEKPVTKHKLMFSGLGVKFNWKTTEQDNEFLKFWINLRMHLQELIIFKSVLTVAATHFDII